MMSAKASLMLGHILIHVDGLELVGGDDAQGDNGSIVAKPLRLLLASLAACTCLTLRELADRNGWSLRVLDADVELVGSGNQTQIHRILSIEGDIEDDQRETMLDAAENTEVTLHLRRGFVIRTELA